MKVIFLSDDYKKMMARFTFTIAMKDVCQLHVVHDAQEILEEAALEDPSTVIYIDMEHRQAEYVREELYKRGTTQKLIVMVWCRRTHRQEDVLVSRMLGTLFQFKPGLDKQQATIDFLMENRAERGLK